MTKFGLFASVLYYMFFTGIFIVLTYWVRDGLPPMTANEKVWALFVYGCYMAFVVLTSEFCNTGSQGLRDDILDVLFDDHE